jgi:hypothetical protein
MRALWADMPSNVPYEVADKAVKRVLCTSEFFSTVKAIGEAVLSFKKVPSGLDSKIKLWLRVNRDPKQEKETRDGAWIVIDTLQSIRLYLFGEPLDLHKTEGE